MRQITRLANSLVLCLSVGAVSAQEVDLRDVSKLELRNSVAEASTYHGLPALKLTEKANGQADSLAVIKGVRFQNGVVELQVAGAPAAGAMAGARGFIGIAFRVQGDGARYECIYLRPTNGRADDQLRRNHSTQYISFPDWPWERLRKESPGVYESYVDMQPGEWIRMSVAVRGTNASLYVGGAEQPCLIVHDLKLGERSGSIALWIGPGTEGYFNGLKLTAR